MRYYDIIISDPKTGYVYVVDPKTRRYSQSKTATTTYSAANQNTSALDIELDIPVVSYAAPQGGSHVRIWGVSLQEISQTSDLLGKQVTVKAGMQKGLPLANAAQAGVICTGVVFQAYGNWVGTEITMDIIILADVGTTYNPKNLYFTWPKGNSFKDAVVDLFTPIVGAPPTTVTASGEGQTSTVAVEGGATSQLTLSVLLENDLVADRDYVVNASTMQGMARQIKDITKVVGGGSVPGVQADTANSYPGVDIAIVGSVIYVFDGSQDAGTITINFNDIIGQPTWVEPYLLSFSVVMRKDLAIGTKVTLPAELKTPYVTTGQGQSFPNTPARNNLTFSGEFVVRELHHYGRFRQPSADSWITQVVVYPNKVTTK